MQSENGEDADKSRRAEADDSGITYFLTINQAGNDIEIITAVDKSWILSDDTSFPVSIDPTVVYGQNGGDVLICFTPTNNDGPACVDQPMRLRSRRIGVIL